MFSKDLRISFVRTAKKSRPKKGNRERESAQPASARRAAHGRLDRKPGRFFFFWMFCAPSDKIVHCDWSHFFRSLQDIMQHPVFYPLGALCPHAHNLFFLCRAVTPGIESRSGAIFFFHAKRGHAPRASAKKGVDYRFSHIFSFSFCPCILPLSSFEGSLVFGSAQSLATKRRARGRPAQSRSDGRRRQCRVARGRRGP